MGITLYRVTNTGDNIGNVPANEKIEFNANTDVDSPNAFITDYQISNTTGIGNNQAAEQNLGDYQDLGPVENMYVFNGFISQRDKTNQTTPGSNPFTAILKKWDEEPKKTDDFKHGRFGIQIDDFVDYNRVPVGSPSASQVGLLWKGISWNNDYAKQPLRADFTIQLILEKGDDQ